jgi:hypothetical protein
MLGMTLLMAKEDDIWIINKGHLSLGLKRSEVYELKKKKFN